MSIYKPLAESEFRLLTLLPGEIGSLVRCRLQTKLLIHEASLPGASYEALSYTWTDPQITQNALTNGEDPNHQPAIILNGFEFLVSHNLYAALQHLRFEDRSRLLWVDALCIDQSNLTERSFQVSLMGLIFSRAIRTLGWLGNADVYTNLAFDTVEEACWAYKANVWETCSRMCQTPLDRISLHTVRQCFGNGVHDRPDFAPVKALSIVLQDQNSRDFELLQKSMSTIRLPFQDDNKQGGKIAIPQWRTSGRVAKAMRLCIMTPLPRYDLLDRSTALEKTFSARSYWERLWIRQEQILAPHTTLICGRRKLNVDTLYPLMSIMEDLKRHMAEDEGFHPLHALWMAPLTKLVKLFRVSGSMSRPSLASNLRDHSTALCSEAKDYVYALLNVSAPLHLIPDYSLSLDEVYIRSTQAIIYHDQELTILFMKTEKKNSKTPDLPSWVPAFDKDNSESISHFSSNDLMAYDSGCCPITRRVIHTGRCHALPIHGTFISFIYDTGVRPVAERFKNDKSGLASRFYLHDTVNKFTTHMWWNSAMSPEYGCAWEDLQSISTNVWRVMFLDSYPLEGSYARISHSEEIKRAFLDDLNATEKTENGTLTFNFRERLKHLPGNICLCTTSDDRLAAVVGDLQPGDRIFVAHGASIPLILRGPSKIRENDYICNSCDDMIGSSCYTFVGGSYVDGIMDGEVLKMINDGKLKEETVFLM